MLAMPSEVLGVDEFVKLSQGAIHCRVRRSPDKVKLKLRTKRRLYTLKLDPSRVDEVLRSLKCEIREA